MYGNGYQGVCTIHKWATTIRITLLRHYLYTNGYGVSRTVVDICLFIVVFSFLLGPSYTRSSLPKLIQLWLGCFPQNSKDIEVEKSKGNISTWLHTIENRAGALSCMSLSFILFQLDVLKRNNSLERRQLLSGK